MIILHSVLVGALGMAAVAMLIQKNWLMAALDIVFCALNIVCVARL